MGMHNGLYCMNLLIISELPGAQGRGQRSEIAKLKIFFSEQHGHRRKHRGDGGTRPPRICSGGDANVIRPPRFWPVGHMLCNESLSSAEVQGLTYSSPPGSRCGMTRISLAPLRPHTAVVFRRDVTAPAFCRRVISCLPAKNAGNLLPSVTLMMYTDKLCYTN